MLLGGASGSSICAAPVGAHHLRVVPRLSALVGHIVEDHFDGPIDDDVACNPGHIIPLPSGHPIGFDHGSLRVEAKVPTERGRTAPDGCGTFAGSVRPAVGA